MGDLSVKIAQIEKDFKEKGIDEDLTKKMLSLMNAYDAALETVHRNYSDKMAYFVEHMND